MGNRAVVVFEDATDESAGIGVYLHWNGGIESVQAFIDVTQERVGKVNLVGFVQTVANYFQYNGYSLYVGPVDKLDTDNGDNGTFYIRGGKIVRREHAPKGEGCSFRNAKSREYCNGVRAHARLVQPPKDEHGF